VIDRRFRETFAALRAVLEPHAKELRVTIDEPGRYQLASPTMVDRVGRPLFCASVQINKHYVSYHLMPLSTDKPLLDSVSASLRSRMQGKACFNFSTIEPGQLKELAAITTRGIAGFKNLTLPWTSPVSTRKSTGPPCAHSVGPKSAKSP
jgi:hypothetical protein